LLGLTQSDTQVFATRSYGENLFGKKFFYWKKGHISRKRECMMPTTLQAFPEQQPYKGFTTTTLDFQNLGLSEP